MKGKHWGLFLGLLFFLVSGQVWAEEKWYDRIDLGLSVAGVVQGVFDVDQNMIQALRDPDNDVLTEEDKGYAAISADLEASTEFTSTDRAYMLLEMGSGRNPEQDVTSFAGIIDEALSMVPVATDDGDVRISEAWYEHDFVFTGVKARLRFGKVDLTTDFDTNEYANDECAQFISPEFINNIAVEFPDYGFGSMLWIETDKVSFGLGYADADADWSELFDYLFFIGELDIHANLLNHPGNYRFYAWYNGTKHDEILGSSTDNGYGFGLSFDQEVTDGVGVFFRYGWQDGDVYEFDHAISGGIVLSGKLWGREGDTLGLGFGVAFLSDDYEKSLRSENYHPDDEYHLEVYYSLKVNDFLTITPDVEWTDNPSGYDDYDHFWVVSTRATWEF